MDKIIVKMKRGPDWIFERSCVIAWIKKTRENVYRLFIHDPDVWIGRFEAKDGGNYWFTCESKIGAKEVHFGRGKYIFR